MLSSKVGRVKSNDEHACVGTRPGGGKQSCQIIYTRSGLKAVGIDFPLGVSIGREVSA